MKNNRWQLVKDGVVLAEHSTREAVVIEAIEHKLVIRWTPDFLGDSAGACLVDGVKIIRKEPGHE